MSDVVAIVPARGGSQGVMRKNLRLLAGKPLLWYTINSARNAARIQRVIVSTEDREIADYVASMATDVLLHPSELSGPESPTYPVIQWDLQYLRSKSAEPSLVVVLRATSPLRTAEDIDTAISLLDANSSQRHLKFFVPSPWKREGLVRLSLSDWNDASRSAQPPRPSPARGRVREYSGTHSLLILHMNVDLFEWFCSTLEPQVSSVDSVLSVGPAVGIYPARLKRVLPDGHLVDAFEPEGRFPRRRQEFEPLYLRNGAIYVARPSVIDAGGLWGSRCLAYVMPEERSININTEHQLRMAELVLLYGTKGYAAQPSAQPDAAKSLHGRETTEG